MSWLLLGTLGLLASVASVVLHRLLVNESLGLLTDLTHWQIRRSARNLPPARRGRYTEEWIAEANAMGERQLKALVFAIGLRRASRGICSEAVIELRPPQIKVEVDPDFARRVIDEMVARTATKFSWDDVAETFDLEDADVGDELARIMAQFDSDVQLWRKRLITEVEHRLTTEWKPDVPRPMDS